MSSTVSAVMSYDDWMAAAQEEYRRLDVLLRSLAPEDWGRPTDCTEWDVRAMVAHLVGAAESNASIREMARQGSAALRSGRAGDLVDRVNAVQVRERAQRHPDQLVEDLLDAGRRGVAARSRLPAPVRALRLPFGPPLGVRSLGYLMGRIYTRDAWMHRVDICRATGGDLRLTPEHDGRLVDDVVREWATAHGSPYRLRLTGPAGGSWADGGSDAEEIELDAVEMMRVVSGRAPGAGLLATRVPF